jgi:glycosyltransferase involved in cell wall biosynthesis
LHQFHSEIIIVAADSHDDTVGVAHELAARRPEVRVLAGSKKGPATARNTGLREATSDIIVFNDADDVWPRGKLVMQLQRLDRDPPVDVVAGLVTYFGELDRDILAPAMCSRVETTFIYNVGSMVLRRSVFDRIGLFDETLTYGEDLDLFLRILEAEVPFVILNTPTLYHRRHGDSMMTRDDPRKKSDLVRVTTMSLARRRKSGLSLNLRSFDRYLEEPPVLKVYMILVVIAVTHERRSPIEASRRHEAIGAWLVIRGTHTVIFTPTIRSNSPSFDNKIDLACVKDLIFP